jgi:hypothetical protein
MISVLSMGGIGAGRGVAPDGVDRELASDEPVQVLAVNRNTSAQGQERVTDEGGGQVARVLIAARVWANDRDDAPPRLARLLGELGEIVLDRLPRGKQQQLEQRGLDGATRREHELEVIGHHLVDRLTSVDDVTGEGRDLVRISRGQRHIGCGE